MEIKSINVQWRKEYMEFFFAFFITEEDVPDELKLRAEEEYERLKE